MIDLADECERKFRCPLGIYCSCFSGAGMRPDAFLILQVRPSDSQALQVCCGVNGLHEENGTTVTNTFDTFGRGK